MELIPFPQKKYQIIYADPPWAYRDKCRAGARGACYKYEVMDYSDLQNMAEPIKEIAAEDCVLFMWATGPMMDRAIYLIQRWGFKFKTVGFTWTKRTVNGKPFMGMGNYTRANPEFCLLAIKGKPRRINAGIRAWVDVAKGRHSEKPQEVREAIVRLMGDLPRIELFARQRAPGWDSWGNEI